MPAWDLSPGDTIRRVDLHNRHGGVRQGGISPAPQGVFLFTDDAVNHEHGYLRDHWDPDDPDLFLYCGEGQTGHQHPGRYNGSVLGAAAAGRALRLFQGVRGTVTYVGEMAVDARERYFYDWGPGRDGVPRRVLMFRLRPLTAAPEPSPPTAPAGGSGQPPADSAYRPADEQAATTTDRALAGTDPDRLDRALRAHATTQNLLAEWVRARALVPLSPGPAQPPFDLAWRARGRLVVAEVKSLTPATELTQVRLGLGQVLDYAHTLTAQPALVLERRPTGPRWARLCREHGVVLAWPSALERLAGLA